MERKIRQNIFETNSSSTHSICISINTNGLYDTIIPNEDGNIELCGGEFGWEQETYNDALTKANYCAVDNINNDTRLEMLKNVIKSHTGCNEVIILAQTDNWNKEFSSYIDHQSSGTSSYAFGSEAILKEFIFNPKSILITDNDNH